MNDNYRKRLFRLYDETHVRFLDSSDEEKIAWFRKYASANYSPHIKKFNKETSRILEIGCNKGYLLSVLGQWGYQKLFGIDLSPEAVQKAKTLVPDAEMSCVDASQYLGGRKNYFDVVILKAVLEHVPKKDIFPFLNAIRESLRNGGLVLIDVPNMDWFFASHERYMDFTHEVGFTKESLRQVMSQVFKEVSIATADNIFVSSFVEEIKKRTARFLLGKLFFWADGQGGAGNIWHRTIIGAGKW